MGIDLTAVQAKMNALQEQMEKLREEASEQGKAAFTEACKILFESYPQLKAFRWEQYTPYFCDGDPCEFSVYDVAVSFNVPVPESAGWCDDEEDTTEEGIVGGFWDVFREAPEPFATIAKDCAEVRNLMDKDTCLELFGDHVQVAVTRDGVETDSCDHD